MPEFDNTNGKVLSPVQEVPFTEPLPARLRDVLNGIDPLQLQRYTKLGAVLVGVAASLLLGANTVSAMDLEGLKEANAGHSLLSALMDKAGDVLANLGGIFDQDPEQGFMEKAFDAVVVDGGKALLDIYHDSATFAKSKPKMAAGIIAGGIHALFGMNKIRQIFQSDYAEILSPKLPPREVDEPRRDGSKDPLWKRLILDFNPLFLVAGFTQSSYFMDSITTGLTISNAKPTPAWLLSLGMLATKYWLTGVGYKNMIKLEDLVDMKRSYAARGDRMPVGKTLEFIVRVAPVYWGLALLEFATDIALVGSWIKGHVEDEY